MNKLTKTQVDTLLNMLDTMASLGLSPNYTVIWEYHYRTVFDIHWHFASEDPRFRYDITIRDELQTIKRFVLDIAESKT